MYDRLFQRGQTWDECRAGWSRERRKFARSAAASHVFSACNEVVGHFSKGTRVLVTYFPDRIDSLRILPLLGAFLHQQQHLEARYFDLSLFFPVMHKALGRQAPILAMLNDENKTTGQWGPRPEALTSELEDLGTAKEKAVFLDGLDESRLVTMVDQSLARFLTDQVNAT
jgi:hypothetical protein